MFVDTPATIAVLGGGPCGLETALYARYLGYHVELLERDRIAARVLQLGATPLDEPFRRLHSTLGLAALRAQDPDCQLPEDSAVVTASVWATRYLLPLAHTDLLADHIHPGARVCRVERGTILPATDGIPDHDMPARDAAPDEGRAGSRFTIRALRDNHQELTVTADIVIDTTGRGPIAGERTVAPAPARHEPGHGADGDAGPEWGFLSGLAIDICPETGGLAAVANWLRQPAVEGSAAPWAELLRTGAPNLYVLGAKTYGRRPRFHFTDGLDQIRALFGAIGGRADLNVYATL